MPPIAPDDAATGTAVMPRRSKIRKYAFRCHEEVGGGLVVVGLGRRQVVVAEREGGVRVVEADRVARGLGRFGLLQLSYNFV